MFKSVYIFVTVDHQRQSKIHLKMAKLKYANAKIIAIKKAQQKEKLKLKL